MCFILQILPLYNSIIQFKYYMFWIEKAQFNSERSMIPVHSDLIHPTHIRAAHCAQEAMDKKVQS